MPAIEPTAKEIRETSPMVKQFIDAPEGGRRRG